MRRALGLDQDDAPLKEYYPELETTLGEALLKPHPAYYPIVKDLRNLVKCMAHVTGGGLPANVPRVLPEGLGARLDKGSWPLPTIFSILQDMGGLALQEMYEVFNMGIGFVLVCAPTEAGKINSAVPDAVVAGEIIEIEGERRVIL